MQQNIFHFAGTEVISFLVSESLAMCTSSWDISRAILWSEEMQVMLEIKLPVRLPILAKIIIKRTVNNTCSIYKI